MIVYLAYLWEYMEPVELIGAYATKPLAYRAARKRAMGKMTELQFLFRGDRDVHLLANLHWKVVTQPVIDR